MTTTTAPLLSEQERTILHTEGARKGWSVDFLVTYSERELPYQVIGQVPPVQPEWSVIVRATKHGDFMEATIRAGDSDRARFLTRSFVEGLPAG